MRYLFGLPAIALSQQQRRFAGGSGEIKPSAIPVADVVTGIAENFGCPFLMQLTAAARQAIEWVERVQRVRRSENSRARPRSLSPHRSALEQPHAVTALEQFVSNAQPDRPATDYRHVRFHELAALAR